MRFLLICTLFLLVGCGGKKRSGLQASSGSYAGPGPTQGKSGDRKIVVTTGTSLIGKVAWVNTTDRFVVLNFPLGRLPGTNQMLNLYRGGLKVGEVKVTGPQYDDNVVADLVAGDSQVGDQVQDK
jgi:hypothetical protein